MTERAPRPCRPSANRRLADAILDLHKPWYEIGGKRYTHRVTIMAEDMAQVVDHVCVVAGEGLAERCLPGEEHQVEACSECRVADEDGNPASLIWPCPTARLAMADGDQDAAPACTPDEFGPCSCGGCVL